MTGQGPGFAGQNTSLVGQKRKKGRESDRPGQALARQNPKFVGHLTDDWLLFAGLGLTPGQRIIIVKAWRNPGWGGGEEGGSYSLI